MDEKTIYTYSKYTQRYFLELYVLYNNVIYYSVHPPWQKNKSVQFGSFRLQKTSPYTCFYIHILWADCKLPREGMSTGT